MGKWREERIGDCRLILWAIDRDGAGRVARESSPQGFQFDCRSCLRFGDARPHRGVACDRGVVPSLRDARAFEGVRRALSMLALRIHSRHEIYRRDNVGVLDLSAFEPHVADTRNLSPTPASMTETVLVFPRRIRSGKAKGGRVAYGRCDRHIPRQLTARKTVPSNRGLNGADCFLRYI